jgi:hypothetical protein
LTKLLCIISIKYFARPVNGPFPFKQLPFSLKLTMDFQKSCPFLSHCWNEIKGMSILKVFWKLNWLKTQHTSFNICDPLITWYFENKNWLDVRLKQFVLSLLWFFVLILNSRFGCMKRWPSVDFNNKRFESRLEVLLRKIVSFE